MDISKKTLNWGEICMLFMLPVDQMREMNDQILCFSFNPIKHVANNIVKFQYLTDKRVLKALDLCIFY